VPALDLQPAATVSLHKAAPKAAPPALQLPTLDIDQLGRTVALPQFADNKHPSVEEAQAIVHAFFGPVDEEAEVAKHEPLAKQAKTARSRRKVTNNLEPLTVKPKTQATGQAAFDFASGAPTINLSKLDE
jgi:hypothetical protein